MSEAAPDNDAIPTAGGAARVLTFGYGSNMCLGRMQWRVPSLHFRCVAELRGYRLVFNKTSTDRSGKANVIVGTNQDKTLGVVFGVAKEHEQRLRDYEAGYNPQMMTVYDVASGESREVSVYIAGINKIQAGLRPYTWYRRHIVCGGGHWGLDPKYLRTIEAALAYEDPDQDRTACELSFPCDRVLTDDELRWHDEHPCHR
jgi:cation transport regulator ChaC